MKNTALKLMLWLNYIGVILFVSWQTKNNTVGLEAAAPLVIASLMLIDSTYISSCNIRENKILSLFCGLLALDSWYIILSFEKGMIEDFVFAALGPMIWYASISFLLMFLFQGSGYKFRKAVNILLLAGCIGAVFGIVISPGMYALLYGLQFLINLLCIIFILIYHRKRVSFVIKSEYRSLLLSMVIIGTALIGYCIAARNVENHMANFGIYLPMLLFFMSVHGIVLKEQNGTPLSSVFSKRQMTLMICLWFAVIANINWFMGNGCKELFIMVNGTAALIYLCNIFLGYNLKHGSNKIIKESAYNQAIQQLQQEELLKTEFANFLHDDILQDLLSIKNMMTKIHRPEVQEIVIETMEHLNTHIREQVQDYHPVILKSLTAKENYQNLIEAVSQSFPHRSIQISFHCPSNLFLVEPYNLLVYRMLKELLSNIYKHSDGNRAWITLTQEKGMILLNVSDDGTSHSDTLNEADQHKHKGLASITEQINKMEGSITIFDNTPHGICVQIQIPMKGEASYQYFVS